MAGWWRWMDGAMPGVRGVTESFSLRAQVQMFCDPDAGVGKPLDYFVLEEDCHYSVTWPSKFGCPVDAGIFGQGSGGCPPSLSRHTPVPATLLAVPYG